ncbi:MAG: ABC transporter ATP-binding protein [Rhizomicrobium sp.]
MFHELWALRSALGLLIPKTDLKAVTVEGIGAPDTSGYQYDGVDCALFYGDAAIDRATRIELLQLKYSTADPATAWTTARLTANKAKKGNNSVLRKLAEAYTHAGGAAAPTAEVIVRLVSNQPIAPEVGTTVQAIQGGDTTSETSARFIEACGLNGEELLRFLSILDFSEMGTGSRAALLDSLTFAVAEIINGNADAQVLVLQGRIRNLMMPGAEREKITQNSVLSWFGLSSVAGLFPAPQDLQAATNPIARQPAKELLDAISGGTRVVCLHGPGGCGKTTTLMQVATLLPPDSISVVFDCYGAGRYTHTNDRRHLPENAFLQIVNELAWAQETPFLMANASTNPAGILTFLERVEHSAKILAAANPTAILAILIDAADNSVAAAELSTPPTPCFVWEVAQADLNRLPANVRIIFSTRTARKSKLRLPNCTPEIICPPFTLDETRAFVQSRHLGVSEVWIGQFHALSSGIPRVQTYAFAKGGASADNVLEALRPSGKKLDTVLRELFQSASVKSGDADFYSRCVAALATLPAPIPVRHLAGVCSCTVATVADFIADVQPTLRIEDDAVTIADEDVEDFLEQESLQRVPQMLQEICQYLAPMFRTDSYAAVHYCDFLARASRAAEILPILERDLLPVGISDPIERREVQLRRLRLALGACRSAKSAPDTLKVVLLSAEAAKDEDALRELLEKETDLSVRFASASLFRLVLTDRDRYPKQGSILAQDAARAALAGDFVSARERLNTYGHWMGRRRELPQDKWRDWEVELDDIVAIVETIAIMDGPRAGKAALMRWKPIENWPKVAVRLIPRLIARGRSQIVESAYQDQILPRPWSLMLTVPLALSGHAISAERLIQELTALRRSNVPDIRLSGAHQEDNWELPFLETTITACEIGFSRGVDAAVLLPVLNLILDHRHSPSANITRLEAFKIDIALRAWLLRNLLKQTESKSIEFNEWIKNSNAPPPKKKRGRKKKAKAAPSYDRDDEMARTISAIFPIYTSRLSVLLEGSQGAIVDKPKAALLGLSNDAYYFDRDHWSTEFRRRAGQSVVRLMHVNGLSVSHLYAHAETITAGKYDDAFASRSVAVWEELLLRPSMHQAIVDGITARAEKLRHVRTGAKTKADALIKFSRLVLNFSEGDARALFERTIEIVQEIDREAMVQIEFVAGLATKQGVFTHEVGRALAAPYAAFVTDVAIRLEGEEHFPWEKATEAICNLAPEVGLAAISQWQDEGIAALNDTLPVFASSVARLPLDKLLLSCALLVLLPNAPTSLFRTLGDVACTADAKAAASAFEMLASYCLLHVPPGSRTHIGQLILKAIPSGLATGPNVARLRETVSFCEEPDSVLKDRAEAEPQIQFATNADFTTASGIIAAIADAKERHKGQYVALRSVLAAAREHITLPAQRVPYLDAMAAFDGDSLYADDRASAIQAALDAWRGGPAVENWRATVLPQVIADNLWPLSRWLHERSRALHAMLDASGLAGQDRIDVMARGLEAGADGFSSAALFNLSEIMAPALSAAEAKEIAEWYIARLYRHVPTDIQSRYDLADIPADFDTAFGRFLFAQMSDIDLRIRWRAAHCMRQLVAQVGGEPLSSLFQAYPRTAELSFRLSGAPFYWLAARLWTVITAARIAAENPSAGATVAQNLLTIALDKDLPHYLIRANAKTALETLINSKAITFKSGELSKLEDVNRPKKTPIKVKRGTYRDLQRHERKERRFKFDGLDTVRYWYDSLYRQFATLTADKFFSTLEKWLIDRWKVDPEANWWAKEPRQSRFNDRDQMRSHHGHGSQPTIERYGTYLEWHAMHCGLGEWLKTEPLVAPEWESDRFAYYVRRWNPTEPPAWLADRRSFTPLERDFVFEESGEDKHWLRRVPRDKFVSAVVGRKDADTLAVEGHWTISRPKRQTEISVSSALVSPDTALSLMRTFQAADEYRFHLPFEKEEESDDIEELPFVLRSWIALTERERQFDEHDPLRNEVTGLAYRPARWLRRKFRLKAEGTPESTWCRPKGDAWFSYEAWSDFDTSEHDSRHSQRQVGAYGYRLKVDRHALRTILASEKLDLIVKVQVERRLENEYGRSSYSESKEKRRTARKIFILRQDGAIEDASGRIATWHRVGVGAGECGGTRPARKLDGAALSRKARA